MEPADPITTHPPEEQIAAAFRAFDYDVQQTVGIDAGTVDWFAVPRRGFVRSRTYFRVLKSCPESFETALIELDAARKVRGADRAVAIVMEGALPEGYAPDLVGSTVNILTFRRWLLEISGIADSTRTFVQTYERENKHERYVPRRARLSSGQEVAVESWIDEWAAQPQRPLLILQGAPGSGVTTVATHATYRAAVRFTKDAESTTPFLWPAVFAFPNFDPVWNSGFVIPVVTDVDIGRMRSGPRQGLWIARRGDPPPEVDRISLELIAPSSRDISEWFSERLGSSEPAAMLQHARRYSPDFATLSNALPSLDLFLEVLRAQSANDLSVPLERWVAGTVINYVNRLHTAGGLGWDARGIRTFLAELEEVALHEFALGLTAKNPLRTGAVEQRISESWFDGDTGRFRNHLMRDYFLARKVVREVEAGNVEILLRYQLSQSVLLFITMLAPDVAARITGGRVARLEEKMQEEVERKLYLTFAHMLHRPVGSIRTHLQQIREKIGKDRAAELARPLDRIMEEVAYVAGLAEKTRLWQTEPKGTPAGVPLRSLVEELAMPLREKHPAVAWTLEMDPGIRVRSIRDALRDVLHCLLENAFHAASTSTHLRGPEVNVAARIVGDVVRVELRDTGAGVPSDDRERIFDPYVTTKKGGAGKPQGTGLGLSIARRYAEHMGGRVGLDASQSETCFFVELVSWRESG